MNTNTNDFMARFGTEKQCLDFLYCLRWSKGYQCPRCQHSKAWQVGEMKYKCQNCGYQTTVISGTLLHGTHLPLTVWFQAAWHMASHTDGTNASALQEVLQIGSNRTALSLLSKLRTAMANVDKEKLSGKIIVDKIRINKELYRYAYIAVDCQQSSCPQIRMQSADDITQNQHFDFIRKNIKQGSTIQTNGIGLMCRISDRYKLEDIKKCDSKMLPQISDIKLYLKNNYFLGTAQNPCTIENYNLYLAECCFKFNRRDKSVERKFAEVLMCAISVY